MITDDTFKSDRRYVAFSEALRFFNEHGKARQGDWNVEQEKVWRTKRNALDANLKEARRRFVKAVDDSDLADAIECVFVARAEGRWSEEMVDFSGVQAGLNDFIPHDYDLYELMKPQIRKVLNLLVNTGRAVTIQVDRAPGTRPYGARGDMWLWQTPEFVEGLYLQRALNAERVEGLRVKQAALVDALVERGIHPLETKTVNTIVLSLEDAEVILSMMA